MTGKPRQSLLSQPEGEACTLHGLSIKHCSDEKLRSPICKFFNMKLNGTASSSDPNSLESQAEISWMTRRTVLSSAEFRAALSRGRGRPRCEGGASGHLPPRAPGSVFRPPPRPSSKARGHRGKRSGARRDHDFKGSSSTRGYCCASCRAWTPACFRGPQAAPRPACVYPAGR